MFTLPSRQSLLKRPMLMKELPLVLPQTRGIAGGKVSWLVGRIVYSTKHCGFKRNRMKSTHVRFKTTKDLNKSRRFYFGFTHLRVNKKLNPVPKFSGFFQIHQEFGKITTSLRVLTQNLKKSILNIMLNILFMRELKKRRRRRQRERQKSNRFRLAKQQLCTCITIFCTFLSRRCTTTTWKCLISRRTWTQ